MKKLALSLLALSLLPTVVLSEEYSVKEEKSNGIFFGVDYFNGESELSVNFPGFGSSEEDFDQTGYRAKLGVQLEDNIRLQGYFKIEDFDDAFDEKIYGLGFDALFTIPTQTAITPFFSVGLSSDFTELNDGQGIEYEDDTLNALAIKAGVGALFKLNQTVEMQVGYDIQYRTWQDIEFIDAMSGGSVEVEIDDRSNTFYAGLNFFF